MQIEEELLDIEENENSSRAMTPLLKVWANPAGAFLKTFTSITILWKKYATNLAIPIPTTPKTRNTNVCNG